MYTYKAAGPMVGVEMAVIKKLNSMLGWDDNAGGTLAAGGSLTNLMSLIMARDAANNDIRFKGMKGRLVAYTSDSSHYSVPKNAAFAGIGRDQVRFISTDIRGRMIVSELEKQIIKDKKEGYTPFLINSTAGTTVLGAFDPFEQISDVAQKYNIWHHSDGAYCGSILFSKKYKHYLKGVERADSFSLNAHKMLGTPLSCSIILVKDQQHLYNSFSQDASYLYQTDHDEFNLGKISLQCGRRNDALKFWTLWKQIGTKGLEKMVDHQFDLADAARQYIKANSDYTLYSFEDSISICFNYKDIPARDICTKMYEHSELMVGYGAFIDDEFIRFVTINAGNEVDDILNVFKKIESFVEAHF
jgi:sulfinoalanine decarboxylase/sulfinoalanine decarboxylase/aspartate 1-decarboxylase